MTGRCGFLVASCAAALLSCGGKVVVDPGGAGGTLQPSGSSSSSRPACGPSSCTGDANTCTCQAECGITSGSSETQLYVVSCSRSQTDSDWGCTCSAGGDLVAPCNDVANACDVQGGCCANSFWD